MAAQFYDYTKNIQNLMDVAYARWQTNDWRQAEFMAQLTTAEAVAVRLGNMNYQVENGGFHQYWGNSYATRDTVAAVGGYLGQIVAFARTTGHTGLAAAEKVLELYTRFDKALEGNYDPNDYTRRPAYYGDDEEEEDNSDPDVSHLDSPYYEVNDAFMCLAEDWLKATFVLPPLPAPIAAEPVPAA